MQERFCVGVCFQRLLEGFEYKSGIIVVPDGKRDDIFTIKVKHRTKITGEYILSRIFRRRLFYAVILFPAAAQSLQTFQPFSS